LVPACAVEPLVEACVLFTVQLPRADECRVTPTQPRLAALDSTASAAGVSTEVSLEITLVWKKPARELSVQSDERTLVDLSKAGGRLNLQRSATGMKLTVAKGATAGPATVMIYFSNQKVNATFTVTVVEFDHFEVPVAAWPTWASSANFDELGGATELSEIECTRPLKFEQATVGCDVILTDGTKIAGLESRGASLSLANGQDEASLIATLSLPSRVVTPTKAGTVYVHCSFGKDKTDAATRKEIVVKTGTVTVAEVDSFVVKQGRDTLGPSRALRGKAGRDTATSTLVATLDNGRKYTVAHYVFLARRFHVCNKRQKICPCGQRDRQGVHCWQQHWAQHVDR
jgi:hypothetical protein